MQAEGNERLFVDLGAYIFAGHGWAFWGSPEDAVESMNRLVMSPYASIRRSRRKGQCVRLNSTLSRSQGTTTTSSRSTDARWTTWPLGAATKDWPQNWMPSAETGLPSWPTMCSTPMRFGATT